MDYEKMTKAALIRELKKNEVLKPVNEMGDISFGHVVMVEKMANVLNNKHHAFRSIIHATTVDGDLVITLPAPKGINRKTD